MIADELQLRLPDQESPLGPGPTASQQQAQETAAFSSEVLEKSVQQIILEKSNILLLGPTGSGNCNPFWLCELFYHNSLDWSIFNRKVSLVFF